jgi:hypothetical protein
VINQVVRVVLLALGILSALAAVGLTIIARG